MNTVPDKPAAVSLNPNFSTRKVGVHVRKIVATKLAHRNASISNGTAGDLKIVWSVSFGDNFTTTGKATAGAFFNSDSPRSGSRRNAYNTNARSIPRAPKT